MIRDDLHFVADLIRVISKEPLEVVPEAIVRALHSYFKLAACSVYFRSDYDDTTLRLGGQVGFDYTADYEQVSLPLFDSMVGAAVQSEEIEIIDNVSKQQKYTHNLYYPDLVRKYNIQTMIAVPLKIGDGEFDIDCGQRHCYGAICLYPNRTETEGEIQQLVANAKRLAPVISQLYLQCVSHDRIRVREDLVAFATASKDLRSFLYRIVQQLRNAWFVEAASIYVLDERTSTLRLQQTTGLASTKSSRDEVFFPLGDETSGQARVLECFRERRIFVDAELKDQFAESYLLPLRSVVYVPIVVPKRYSTTPHEEVVGVIKCVNRVVQFESLRDSASFGFQDIVRLRLIARFAAVIIIMFARVSHVSEDFEMTVHGIRNNVWTLLVSLRQLGEYFNKHPDIYEHLPSRLHYVIPDSISHIGALQWQVEKFSKRERAAEAIPERLNLHADVISTALAMTKDLAHFYSVELAHEDGGSPNRKARIDLSSFTHIADRFRESPAVYADAKLLIRVFCNLIENAVKYTKYDFRCKIDMWWEDDDQYVQVFFADDGIGIDQADAAYIFKEGYRAGAAIRRTPGASAGLGLFQSRTIMKEMKGDIKLVNAKVPTTFRVSIPKWR